jgi:hypothetical protein
MQAPVGGLASICEIACAVIWWKVSKACDSVNDFDDFFANFDFFAAFDFFIRTPVLITDSSGQEISK